MIKQLNQSAAYICPDCTAVTCRQLNVFDFSGKKSVKLCCGVKECKAEAAGIIQEKDGYKISADCPFCGYEHGFTIKKASFWAKDLFVFKCPASDFGIFIIGKSDLVKEEIERQEKIISEFSKEFDSEEKDMLILYDFVALVDKMSQMGLITCECGSDEVGIDVYDEKIIVTCSECGSDIAFEVTNEEYQRVLQNKSIYIKSD